MKHEVWVSNTWKKPNHFGVYWSRGTVVVDLGWVRGTLHVLWHDEGVTHRLDGPAYARGEVSREEAEKLVGLTDPYLMDSWLRDHEMRLAWIVIGCSVCEVQGKLTVNFPNVTTEFIYSKIEFEGSRVSSWLDVAEVLGLMDDGLKQLRKNVRLLGSIY